MIPVLYKATETNFNHNGLGILRDCIECIPIGERNGIYELELTYPVGSFLYEEIKRQNIIKAKANDIHEPQLFRIYYISKPLLGKIKVKAEHITYDLRKNFVPKLEFSGNCSGALDALSNAAAYKCSFNFNSDISMSANYTVDKKNVLNAIVGSKGSILDTYGNGPDIVRDNFNLSILSNGGHDNDVLISFRKNMTGFTCEEDDTNVVTQIYPFAKVEDNTEITLPEGYINSEYINNYPNPITVSIDFSSDDVKTVYDLRQKANNYFKKTKADIPKLNYKIKFEELSKTINYKERFGKTENINLHDTVIIRHEVYGIDTKVKVIKQTYDSIREKTKKLELGMPKTSLNTKISTTIQENTKNVVTTGFLDNAIKTLSNAITGNDGGYVRLNPPENPSEIVIMDNEDINKAEIVWRANKSGLGVSRNGYNGYYYGLTKDGKMVIDSATANLIRANMVKTGMLMSEDSKTWINLDTGEFNFRNFIKFMDNKFSIVLNGRNLEDLLSSKVGTNDFSTLIEQNAYSVRISWNKVSDNVQFENGGLTIYDGSVNTNAKLMRLNRNGQEFYRDGYQVGLIGTNKFSYDNSIKGLSFDLTEDGGYMAWAAATSYDNNFIIKWTYSNKALSKYGYKADTLNAGCDIDMHNNYLRNVKFEGGGISGTMNFVQITQMDTNGTAARWVNNCKLEFKNGILINGTWG